MSRNKAQLRSLSCIDSITRGRCHADVHPKQLTKITFTNSSDVTKDAKISDKGLCNTFIKLLEQSRILFNWRKQALNDHSFTPIRLLSLYRPFRESRRPQGVDIDHFGYPCSKDSVVYGEAKRSTAGGRSVYGRSGLANPEAWLFLTCLEVQNVRCHASTVQHNLRIIPNLGASVPGDGLKRQKKLLDKVNGESFAGVGKMFGISESTAHYIYKNERAV
ncbi:hypothetical protein T4B_572 [Trichinella pseudospiralis]|uniref:Uncharacterized protein n=1 Tax=Trichinella pseudospiralis TaxID=6337 RepID=A0A0V1ITP7_TRIPS|nr:hypothetical protein T4B_572 [Trichinella pseudospiralis]